METLGTTKATQALVGALESYTVWCSSPGAFSDPENATGVDVRPTGNVRDQSQKNLEILAQAIGLRSTPVILALPTSEAALESAGATQLTGEGWTWCFGVEQAQAFEKQGDPVQLLNEELAGIVLANGVVISTTGPGQNIEFRRKENVC